MHLLKQGYIHQNDKIHYVHTHTHTHNPAVHFKSSQLNNQSLYAGEDASRALWSYLLSSLWYCPHTASFSPLWLATLGAPFLALYLGSRGEPTPLGRLSVAMVIDHWKRASFCSVQWREKMWPDAVSWFTTLLSGEMQLCRDLTVCTALVKCSRQKGTEAHYLICVIQSDKKKKKKATL